MPTLTLIPVLGRNTQVSQDDPSLMQPVAEGVILTSDVGGMNYDLRRKRNACSKSYGTAEWSNSANAQATRCQGLFELWDGANRDYIYVDNGKVYVYDGSRDPVDKSGAVTFAKTDADLFCMIRVGNDCVFADRGGTTPYKWQNGDATITKLIDPSAGSGYTEYKFRLLNYFQRRIVGLYSDQTNGDIDIRWTVALPDMTGDVEFAAGNQLYVPNDDPIRGVAQMGQDRLFVYCDDSVNQMVYYPDYTAPFRSFTVVPGHGAVNHHSIVSLGDRHLFFNADYGFIEYRGGTRFPDAVISDNIEADIAGIDPDYFNLIVGKYVPLRRKIIWAVPHGGNSNCTQLWIYDIDTGNWAFEDKAMRYVDSWRSFTNFTWNDLIILAGGAGSDWTGVSADTWAGYTSAQERLVMADTDGKLYTHSSNAQAHTADNMNGYRIEPIMTLGNPRMKSFFKELWVDVVTGGAYSVDFYHRSGDTHHEITNAAWDSLGSISLDSPADPRLTGFGKTARLHQIKWGTDFDDEFFQVNGITLVYEDLSEF